METEPVQKPMSQNDFFSLNVSILRVSKRTGILVIILLRPFNR